MIEAIKPHVIAYIAASGNNTHIFPKLCRVFEIYNTGDETLSFEINGIKIEVDSGYGFSDEFEAFTQVTIIATGTYKIIVKSVFSE